MTTADLPNTSTLRFLTAEGGQVGFEIEGDGPLVVCVPGMGDVRLVYRFLAADLVAAGFRVAVMDLRGHGDSDATFSRYDDVATGQDVLSLIANLGGPATVVGNSMGAGAAAWAAAERPDLVERLVLIGPFVRDVPVPAWKRALFRLALRRPWGRWVWRHYLPKLYPGRRPPGFSDHLATVDASLRRRAHWDAFVRTTRTSHAPVEARLPQVRARTLVVMGERDPDFPDPAAEAAWVADRVRGQTLLVPDAGHYPQAEYAPLVSAAVLSFLGSGAPDA